jgi:beta-glucosidase
VRGVLRRIFELLGHPPARAVSALTGAALAVLSLGAAPPSSVFVDPRPVSGIYRDGWIDLNENGSKDPYEDPTRDVEARITDLLGRMTLEEKTAQMATLYGFGRVLADELPTAAWDTSLWKDGIGNIDEQLNGNTGTDKNLPDPKYDAPWPEHVRALNEIQRWFVERTRLGIPVDFTNEGIRGLLHTKATSFPAQLAVASTWDKALVREIGRITGREARALGYTNVYSPVLDLARDPRWGRTIETYGEDPFLVSELGVEQVRGIQEARVVSTLKHFGVYSVPQGARDGDARTDPHATWSEVQTVLLAPFRRAVRDGHAMGVMASYNDYDGVPVIASSLFLTDILRGEYGFKGYVVSDSGAVEFVHQKHRVAGTPSDGILKAVQAGMNVRTNFTRPEAYVQPLRELVKSGRLPMATVDARVRDVLRVKYWLGLFDAPYGLKPEATNGIVRAKQSLAVADRAARESIVLLKNEGALLPLPRRLQKVLVAGPLADDLRAWWCRYGPQRLDFVTPLAGIRKKLGASAEVRYVKGVEARDANWPESDIYREGVPADVRAGIDAAVKAAAGVDVILLVVGEPEELSRESRSRISLDLPGYQEDLLRALHATGVPLVVIVSSGRPQSVNFAAKHARAIVNLWYLGENGGSALADVLFGDYNPAGRLPITVPRSVGQLPYNFPFKPGAHGRDEGQVSGPLYAFGHGLSYSSFEYSGLSVSPARIKPGGKVSVAVDVRNAGKVAGDEVVQLYVRDDYGSVTTFERSLRGFERIRLAPGQKRRVEFTLGPEALALYDQSRRWTVEPGRFTVLVGASSVDIRQSGAFSVEAADGSVPSEAPLGPEIVP